MSHSLTPQQSTFIDACTARGSIAVNAVAGSGKTFVLQQGARKIRGSGLATSFSRSTVADLKAAMPSNFECAGMHALGLRGIKQKLPQAQVDARGNILYETLKDLLSEESGGWKLQPEIKRLVEIAQLSGIVPDHDRFLLEDTWESWEALADQYDIDFSPLHYQVARAALIKTNQLALKGDISFSHMLTLPLFHSFPVPQFPSIILDEAQDLSPLQHALVARALRPGGRVVIAGDPSQAIFGFSGALSDSYTRLLRKFDCTEYPLTVSWRCARNIVAEAQQYVPWIEAAPAAPEGLVTPATHTDLPDIPRVILCRNNAPLTALAMRLFVAGFSVECAGRDIGAGLKSTISRIAAVKNSDSMRSAEFVTRLNRWAERETFKHPGRKHRIADKREALLALAEYLPTVGAIRNHIESLYIDPDSKERQPAEFHLSTIHRAKGREWDRVGFLDPHLLPAKWAKQEWELQQETNLSYVAVTRAKHELVYLDSKLIL